MAAANEQYLNGEIDKAIAALDKALLQFPTVELYLRRSDWHVENEDYQAALSDCDRARELAPESWRIPMVRHRVLQHLGRWDDAVEEVERMYELFGRNDSTLNATAYARALAGSDLDEALTEAQEALKQLNLKEKLLQQ